MVDCLQVVRIHSLMKEIKVYIPALYIVFLFVKMETNNFIKEIKHVLCAFIASIASPDLLSNSPKHLPQFSPAYESMKKMFYFSNYLRNKNC